MEQSSVFTLFQYFVDGNQYGNICSSDITHGNDWHCFEFQNCENMVRLPTDKTMHANVQTCIVKINDGILCFQKRNCFIFAVLNEE